MERSTEIGTGTDTTSGGGNGISRREALRRGALVGSALWVVPVAQAVSMTPAAADTASAPHSQTGGKPVALPVSQPVGAHPAGSHPIKAVHGQVHAHPLPRRRRVRHHHHHR